MGILDDILKLNELDVGKDDPWPMLRDAVARDLEDTSEDPTQLDRNRLLVGLYESLFSARASSFRSQRQRLSDALIHISMHLIALNVPTQIYNEIVELGNALLDLDRKIVRPIFQVSRTSKPIDPGDIWVCRAIVASAIEAFLSDGKEKSAICTILDRKHAPLGKVLVRKNSVFSSSAFNWRKDLRKRVVKSDAAQQVFDSNYSILAEYARRGITKELFGFKLLADATLLAVRTSDEAMSILMPEIIKRRRVEQR